MLFGLQPITFCKTIWFTDIIDNKEEVCEEEEGLHLNEEQILEERPDGDERLGESHLDVPEGETGVEDEQRLGGQSLEDWEVQPSEPPPTPPPQHTEEGNLIFYQDTYFVLTKACYFYCSELRRSVFIFFGITSKKSNSIDENFGMKEYSGRVF